MEKLVVLADMGRLVAYKVTSDPDGLDSPRVEMVRCMECPDAHTKTSDKVSDSSGRFRRSGRVDNGTRASFGDRHGMKTESRKRLVRNAADQIDSILMEEGMPPWDLAAGSGMNSLLLDYLSPEAISRLRNNLKANLTHLDKPGVLSRFYH